MAISLPGGTATISDEARQLHDDLIMVDGHVHMITSHFYLGIDPWGAQHIGTFDYARARQGGLDVVVEQLSVQDTYNNYNYTVKQTFRLIELFYQVLEKNSDKMALALSSNDVRRIVGEGKMAVILALEGGMDMEGDLDILRLYHRLGIRMIQLATHNTTNALVDTAYDTHHWGGLSERGRAVIKEMNRLGIIIDISHASDIAKSQIISASKAPVATSHNGLKRFSKASGGLTEEHIRQLKERNGLIGLHSAGWFLSQASLDWGYHRARTAPPPEWSDRFNVTLIRNPLEYDAGYINKLDAHMVDSWLYQHGYHQSWRERQKEAEAADAPLATVEDYVEQLDYIARTAGPDHIALGMDLKSGGNWLKDFDATSYPRITAGLLEKGHSEETIGKIMGGNWLRLLDSAKVPGAKR